MQRIAGVRPALRCARLKAERLVSGVRNTQKRQATAVGINVLTAGLLALLGAVLCLIPILGWIAAAFCWMGAFWALLSAIGSPVLNLFTTSSGHEKNIARLRSENTYTDLVCPSCKKDNPFKGACVVNWPNDKDNNLLCQHCGQTSRRVADELQWVPFPLVSLSGDIKEYFS